MLFAILFTYSLFAAAALPPVIEINSQKFYQFGDTLVDISPAKPHLYGSRPLKVELWPNGVLPLRFDKKIPKEVRQMVFDACNTWAQYANIQCVAASSKDNSLYITKDGYAGIGGGCFSMLGSAAYFMGIERRMNLDTNCWRHEIILHEIGHALGLTHEHQRPDRDDYIIVHTDNIEKGFLGYDYKLNFEAQEADLLTPYDFLSIMHYYWRAGAKKLDDKPTIEPKKGYEQYKCVMGFVEELSDGDKQAIERLYGPPVQPPPLNKNPILKMPGAIDYEALIWKCQNS